MNGGAEAWQPALIEANAGVSTRLAALVQDRR